MSLKRDLWLYLTTHPEVSALIAGRLYPERLPETPALPAATYLQVSSMPTYAHDGPTGWGRARVQLDAYAETPLEAEEVADALSAALAGWHGADRHYAGFEETRADTPEPELGRYRVTLDAMINREE